MERDFVDDFFLMDRGGGAIIACLHVVKGRAWNSLLRDRLRLHGKRKLRCLHTSQRKNLSNVTTARNHLSATVDQITEQERTDLIVKNRVKK